MLIELTAEALRANISGKSAFSFYWGQFDPKISGRKGRPQQPFFFRKLGYVIIHME